MVLRTGNMWKNGGDNIFFVVTTNSYVKTDGRLVMGRGAARQAKKLFPNIDVQLGKVIPHLSTYGFLFTPQFGVSPFQTKTTFRLSSDPDLIELSTAKLRQVAELPQFAGGKAFFYLNMPGVGHGNLSRNIVLPIIKALPDNVHVWEYE